MARRGDRLSFLPRRRRHGLDERRRLLPSTNGILVLIFAASAALAVFAWLREDSASFAADAPPGTVLAAITTSTTLGLPAGTDFLECPVESEGWTTFQSSVGRTGCVVPSRRITDPIILWQTEVGIQGWLNNPVVAGGRVYVGSAGSTQFETDSGDGVYGIDLTTGQTVWHFVTENDVNGVAFSDDVVVATGDEGRVWGIAATGPEAGRALWTEELGASVFTNPLIVGGLVVVGDGDGEVTAFDLLTGERRWRVGVAGPVRGGASSDGNRIFVVGEEGGAAAIAFDGTVVWRQDLVGRGTNSDGVRVYAAPTVSGNLLIIPLVREDVYSEPAFLALDKANGSTRWRAVDTTGFKTQWGNVRSSPALIGNLFVYGEPYSGHLVAVEVVSGETRWAVELGPFCFPHWPSPAVASGQVLLPRHDGGLYAVDAATGTLAWAINVGDSEAGGNFPDDVPDDFCDWQPKSGFPVLASPAVSDNGIVLVGSLEGVLTAVGDAGW